MSDYKRLLSYIYAYDGDYKMNGTGFAKMEVRDEKYRLTVNLNCALPGQGSGYHIGVYGVKEDSLIVADIGKFEQKNSGYIFRITGAVQSFAAGKVSIEEAGGLVVYREAGSRIHVTSWSDPSVQIRELRESIYRIKNGSEQVKEIESDKLSESNKKPEMIIEYKNIRENRDTESEEKTIQSAEPDKGIQENREVIEKSAEPDKEIQENRETVEKETEGFPKPEINIIYNDRKEAETRPESYTEIKRDKESKESVHSIDKILKADNDFIKNLAELGRAAKSEEPVRIRNKENELKAASEVLCDDIPEVNREMKEEQLKASEVGELWHELKRMYPKIRPFSESGWEVLQIKLQDIGRLSRENWILGNNNFVLHGYYRYGYLILARKHKPDMDVYILGVPGIFSMNEKFMSSMFGMTEFMEADNKRPDLPKNFGYWCTHITM